MNKTCAVCGETKDLSEFYKAYVTADGEVKYGAKCKECSKRYSSDRVKRKRSDPESREEVNQWYRDYRRKQGLKGTYTTTKDGMRPCRRCGETKPVAEFNQYKGKLKSWCKQCDANYLGEWQKKNKEYRKQYAAQKQKHKPLKVLACANVECRKEFQQTDPKQKYCSAECRRSQVVRNPEKQREYSKKRWAKRVAENPPKIRKPGPNALERTCTKCGGTKPAAEFQKGYNTCQACWKIYEADRHQRHKAYYKEQNRKRKMRKQNAEGFHTDAEWEALKAKYNYACLRCGKQEPTISLTRDHVKPLILGGTDYIDNIQPLCHSCNSQKNDTEIDYR